MKIMIGRVVSTKMQKSVVVVVERKKRHPLYKKEFVSSKKFIVDDPLGVKMGDLVEIIKIAPVSKNKHFRVAKVVGKNLEEITNETLKAQAEEIVSEVMPEKKEEDKVEGIGSSEEKIENKKVEKKKEKSGKEKLAPKP